eukprot:364013-Chlamydomonas_euryale.AAC.18
MVLAGRRSSYLCSRPTSPQRTWSERALIVLWPATHSQEACERQISCGCGPSAGGPPPPWACADRH